MKVQYEHTMAYNSRVLLKVVPVLLSMVSTYRYDVETNQPLFLSLFTETCWCYLVDGGVCEYKYCSYR